MKQRRNWLYAIIASMFALASVFCNMPSAQRGDDNYVATLAAIGLTQTAMALAPSATTTPSATSSEGLLQPSETPAQTGSISGKLSYPSEWIPAQRVVAFHIGTDDFYFVETAENQSTYQILNISPGTYHVVSYQLDGELSAGYTQAVPCGLSVDCNDHSLIDVIVIAGEEIVNIDPSDWYAPPDSFPPDPLNPPSDAPAATVGSLSGQLSYPSEGIPALQVVAFRQGSGEYYSVETAPNQSTYVITNLPSGMYQVVAYRKGEDFAGGYTQAVLCGLTVDCSDHGLILVTVDPGRETTAVNPMDWYAPEGTFPPNPLK
jgi:hypothetical protein